MRFNDKPNRTLNNGDEVQFDLTGCPGLSDPAYNIAFLYRACGRYMICGRGNGIIFKALGVDRSKFLGDLPLRLDNSSASYWPEPTSSGSNHELVTEVVCRLFDEIERRKNPMLLVAEWAKKVDEAKLRSSRKDDRHVIPQFS